MPWCEQCARYLVPTSLDDRGACPTCGRVIEDEVDDEANDESPPWHFKLLVAATAIYLGWRFVQIFT